MKQENIQLGEQTFSGISVSTTKANLLMIKSEKGFLGCGYFNLEVAEKLDEAVALVTGVKTFDDMLNAEVFAVSSAATACGIKIGMKGSEALPLLHG